MSGASCSPSGDSLTVNPVREALERRALLKDVNGEVFSAFYIAKML